MTSARCGYTAAAEQLKQPAHFRRGHSRPAIRLFNAGEYNPDSHDGQKLLAHELVHVKQQSAVVSKQSVPYVVQRQANDDETSQQTSDWLAPLRSLGEGLKTTAQAFSFEEETDVSDQEEQRKRRKTLTSKSAKEILNQIIRMMKTWPKQLAQYSPPSKYTMLQQLPWADDYIPLLDRWHKLLMLVGRTMHFDVKEHEGASHAGLLKFLLRETSPIISIVQKRRRNNRNELRIYSEEIEKLKKWAKPEKPVELPPVSFPLWGKAAQVAPADFFAYASENPSETEFKIGAEGTVHTGDAHIGDEFAMSNRDRRKILWKRAYSIMFLDLSDKTIKSQDTRSFNDEISAAPIIRGGENALGSAIMGMIMVEIMMSFMPLGKLVDLAEAGVAVAKGDWKGAAWAIAPGGLEAVGKTRAGAKAAGVVTQAVKNSVVSAGKGAASFVGRGVYKLKSKLGRGAKAQDEVRGIWLVTEAGGGGKAYYFIDEATGRPIRVPEADANMFVRCSKCDLTPMGGGKTPTSKGAKDFADMTAAEQDALMTAANKALKVARESKLAPVLASTSAVSAQSLVARALGRQSPEF